MNLLVCMIASLNSYRQEQIGPSHYFACVLWHDHLIIGMRKKIMEPLGYEHGIHAANAGDVWKHFILAEVADYLCAGRRGLTYMESHAGHPEYILSSPGQWQGGIGRCWLHLPDLRRFKYFDILADMNPEGLKRYPGSVRLVIEIAGRCGMDLDVEVWDIDPYVASEWAGWPHVHFHRGDGFSGACFVLGNLNPGLLLIDPPYVDCRDAERAYQLFLKARELGWTALWWSMYEGIAVPGLCAGIELHTLRFADAGMDGGRWKCASMALYSPDCCLAEHLRNRSMDLIEVLNLK